MTITLAELRTQCRQRADMENTTHISDGELNSYINSSIAELHDILTQVYSGEYNINVYEFNTAVNTDEYALPADFYKAKGVDARLNGSDWFELKKFNLNERNRYQNFGVWSFLGTGNVRYRLIGNNIRFSPTPDKETPIRLWYVPVAETLVDDSDELRNYNGYHEYILVDVAIKMLLKEESDATVFYQLKKDLIKRIEEAAQNRDAGQPESISDIYEANDTYWRAKS